MNVLIYWAAIVVLAVLGWVLGIRDLVLLPLIGAYGFLVWLIAKSAESKGRSFAAWLFLAIFFLPLAAIIVATIAPLSEGDATTSALSRRTCPYCAEEVQVKAIKCKHCGEDISEGN